MMDKINLLQKFDQVTDFWSPKIVGELNGQQLKLARLKGDFIWHHHEHEDEAFFVMKGSFQMEFRDKVVQINEGEMIIVPKGVEHRPVAEQEAWVMLFEPASTVNTGNVENDEKTKKVLERIA